MLPYYQRHPDRKPEQASRAARKKTSKGGQPVALTAEEIAAQAEETQLHETIRPPETADAHSAGVLEPGRW